MSARRRADTITEALDKTARSILGDEVGRAFVDALASDWRFLGRRGPDLDPSADVDYQLRGAEHEQAVRAALEALVEATELAALRLAALTRNTGRLDNDALAHMALWGAWLDAMPEPVRRTMDAEGAHVIERLRQFAAAATLALARQHEKRKSGGRPRTGKQELVAVIVRAYHRATGAMPVVDEKFCQLVDAAFADRHLAQPSKGTIKNVVAGK